MTGPEHYEEAEQLLAMVEPWAERHQIGLINGHGPTVLPALVTYALVAAQTHAALAQAAATALGRIVEGTSLPAADRQAWLFAARTDPKGDTQ